MSSKEISQQICRKYKRMTGQEPIMLGDVLKILTSIELISDLKDYVSMREIEMTNNPDKRNTTQT
jgi:hypothetical protein